MLRNDAWDKQAKLTVEVGHRLVPAYMICSRSASAPRLLPVNSVQVLLQYNDGLLSKQERCKHFIIRQLEVSGRDVTEEEVNDMVAAGKWEVFNENLLNDARITRSQLSEIEQRHKVRQKTKNTRSAQCHADKCKKPGSTALYF